jgi:DNA-binding transcriptional regulator YhcF (GntR family)
MGTRGERSPREWEAQAADPGPLGPPPWLSIRLRPGEGVPLRMQLAAQLRAALADGRCAPGQRLPSGRALASRLGIDRATVLAAYRQLATDGLVRVKPGSGAYARPAPNAPEPGARGRDVDPFRAFVARERARGAGTGELAGLFARWRESLSARRVMVIEEEPELGELWRRELAAALPGVRVSAQEPGHLRRDPSRADGSLVAAPPRLVPSLRALLPPWVELVPLQAPGGGRERRLLLRLAVGAVVLLVSVSPTLRRRFRELAAGLRGREVAALALPPAAAPRLERGLRLARFVLADAACRPELEKRVDRTRLLELRVLDPALCSELAGRLDAEPGRAGFDPPDAPRAGRRRNLLAAAG